MTARANLQLACYHCGLPVLSGVEFSVEIEGASRPMCCVGCQAVAIAICDGGLSRFYQYRSANSSRPDADKAMLLAAYDLPEVQADYVDQLADGQLQIQLMVGGITCAACAWLIEHQVKRMPGITAVRVNVTNHRATVEWQASELQLSQILIALGEIGYQARPLGDDANARIRQHENRRFLQRLGVAAIGMMQAGMLAIGLYAGAFQGMDPVWQNYLRWVSLIIATPVVLFSAFPFFSAAWRNLRHAHLTMDVPISLAIGLAFAASCWATIQRSGEVYFDSVAMFTFFLLVGRYLEMRVRHRNENNAEALIQLLPPTAIRLGEQGDESVPVTVLRPGDMVRITGGDTIPCDGRVAEGVATVIEAVLTGEQQPVQKVPGDEVSAGTVNTEQPFVISVTAVGRKTRLSAILRLVEQAQSEKPSQVMLADRVAGYFVAGVLLVATAVAWWWWQHSPDQAMWVVLSVLVVTCPCALSLATPAALAVATGELRRRGFLVSRGHVIEALSTADQIVFDKTGTLTVGDMSVVAARPLAGSDVSGEAMLQIAAALETGSRHPIAKAFDHISDKPEARELKHHLAAGVSGVIDGSQYALGKAEFVAGLLGFDGIEVPQADSGQQLLLLADEHRPQGWIILQDQLRPGAVSTVKQLQQQGLEVSLLSGDRPEAVAEIANELGVRRWRGGVSPKQKLLEVKKLQQLGHRVVMVGDGINDVPVLSGADVSIAMGDATDFARIHADSILLSGNLKTLCLASQIARKTRKIIRQNLSWALIYNLLALPLAAVGWIPPWAAAIGMSASSLLVVLNAMRLNRVSL